MSNSRPSCRFAHRQHGATLLVMLAILVVGIATLMIGSLNSAAVQLGRDRSTAAALAKAKEALIGYALTYADTHSGTVPGYLPCPDSDASNGEGSGKLSCGSKNVSALGRLPWKTLDLEPLRDGYGECLWYAVSGTYKNNPKTGLMNWDNPGLFTVGDANGGNAADVVAVVFAPGAPLAGQNRTPSGAAPLCGGNYSAANYLDHDGSHDNATLSATANAVSGLFSGPTPQINDRLIYITRGDIWNAIQRRSDFAATLLGMTQKVALCIAAFGTKNGYNGTDNMSLPWPAPLVLADYGTDASYDDSSGIYAGRVPYQVNNSKLATGNSISGSYLLTPTNCPNWSSTDSAWWSNWKDHLFYALAANYRPSSQETHSCGTCLQVNGSGSYAAVVMFAGAALPNQNRSDKSALGAYLEGRNYSNYPNSGGNGDYQGGAGSTFNDSLYCINTDLTVSAYDAVQGKCP